MLDETIVPRTASGPPVRARGPAVLNLKDMISASAIDEVTLWLSAALLSDPAHETDRMVIDRIARETVARPLAWKS